jgi:uncharacterized protein YqeY
MGIINMTILDELNEGIKGAMRSQDKVRLDTLRMLKSKILTVNARGEISDAEVVKLFKTYFGNLEEAFEQAQSVGRPEAATKLKEEMAIVQEYLPKGLSPEETKKIVMQAIADSGAKTKKDLGFVMKAVMKINNTVDGKTAKDIASELLPEG